MTDEAAKHRAGGQQNGEVKQAQHAATRNGLCVLPLMELNQPRGCAVLFAVIGVNALRSERRGPSIGPPNVKPEELAVVLNRPCEIADLQSNRAKLCLIWQVKSRRRNAVLARCVGANHDAIVTLRFTLADNYRVTFVQHTPHQFTSHKIGRCSVLPMHSPTS
jgi:hypothetical protein